MLAPQTANPPTDNPHVAELYWAAQALRDDGRPFEDIREKLVEQNEAWGESKLPLPELDRIVRDLAQAMASHRSVPDGLVCGSHVAIQPRAWLWKYRIPDRYITLLSGDPDVGKSLTAVTAAAHVTRGVNWPDGTSCPRGYVLFYEDEDGFADTTMPRFLAAGGDPTRIFGPDAVGWKGLAHLKLQLEAFRHAGTPIKLMVFSPLVTYAPTPNSWHDVDVRKSLRPFTKLAQEYDLSILAIVHTKKLDGTNPLHKVTGSFAYVQVSRSTLFLTRDIEQQHVVVETLKANLAPAGVPHYTFTIEDAGGDVARLKWGSISTTTPRLLNMDMDLRFSSDAAVALLDGLLGDGSEVLSKTAWERATNERIGERAFRRAYKLRKVIFRREGVGTCHQVFWSYPPDIVKIAQQTQSQGGQAPGGGGAQRGSKKPPGGRKKEGGSLPVHE